MRLSHDSREFTAAVTVSARRRPSAISITCEYRGHHRAVPGAHPAGSYTARTKAASAADYRDQLVNIAVPALILTPEHDTRIVDEAATVLRRGIPDAVEHVLPRTGYMFRFTHPVTYSRQIRNFLDARVLLAPSRQATS